MTAYQTTFGILFAAIAAAMMDKPDSPKPASSAAVQEQPAADRKFALIGEAGLPNAIRVRPNLISGGQPTAGSGFQSLAKLGIKTVVSVDGISPDLKSAKQLGIQYIHLPLGYRGISTQNSEILAHIILTQNEPIYVHCHHGKHRSPAATAVACVTAGFLTNDVAMSLLQQAGTGSQYKGLFQAVADARPIATGKLMQLNPTLQEQADVEETVEVMIRMQESMDRLKTTLQHTVERSDSFEDLKAKRDALISDATLLSEDFTELLRFPDSSASAAGYRKLLLISKQNSKALTQFLKSSSDQDFGVEHTAKANSLLNRISKQCNDCHRNFRHNVQ